MKLFQRCPETGKIVPVHKGTGWATVLFPIAGLASLIWFVVRVVPKPSRAAYPCQRVAAPLASSFLVWLLGVSGSAVAFRQARSQFRRARSLAAVGSLALAVAAMTWALTAVELPAPRAAYPPHAANQPLGTARGLAPGRVVWVHDPDVTDWAGPDSGTYWFDHVDQQVANEMMSRALQTYTGTDDDAQAWGALFLHFNGGTGYAPGEKIAIKINLVTAVAKIPGADENYDQLEVSGTGLDSIANAPQLVIALLDQLVNVVGIEPSDITVGDPTGLYVNHLYEPVHAAFPAVHYLDNRGTLGRTRAEFGTTPFYWSTTDADATTQDYIPATLQQAKYLINFAVLKSHDGAGVTLTAKNHFGSLLRYPDGFSRDGSNAGQPPYNGYYDMHATLPGDNFWDDPAMTTMSQYRALVDLMGHEELGGKTLLYLVDGLFGGQRWYAEPQEWSMPPFNDDWSSSLFLSMDPVAIDSVGRDFLSQQWPEDVLMYEGVEDYLHEAALAGNPPSGTHYDPERDGVPLPSLGVHEHWNNAVDKQYSRNLGSDDGIELVLAARPPVGSERLYLPLIRRSSQTPR